MSKTKNPPAAQTTGGAAEAVAATDQNAVSGEQQAAGETAESAQAGAAEQVQQQAGGGAGDVEQPELQNDPPQAGATVKALVLFDSVYGKCGEVKDFPAETVEGIAAAGYIDAHPKAVAAHLKD